jgi:hypothetical protein
MDDVEVKWRVEVRNIDEEGGASITWMAAGEAPVVICVA